MSGGEIRAVATSRLVCVTALSIAVLAGCDASEARDAGTNEAGMSDSAALDGARTCERSDDCDNGVYCDGVEACVSTVCVSGTPPCDVSAGAVCIEEERRCTTNECEADGGDADTDGRRRGACMGDDCDDSDGNRYPGNAEICDAEGHDEDCNPSTVGDTDLDADGFVSDECCNGDTCGEDCDDSLDSVYPDAIEICDGVDQDCDGRIDEGLPSVTCWPDSDGDGWGRDTGSMTACGCPAGYAPAGGDCHDAHPDVHPDAGYHGASFGMPPTFYASWDYNCDGVEELRWTDGSMLGCFGSPPTCGLDEGWSTRPLREECGQPAQLVECTSTCSTVVVSRPQECR